MNRQWNDFVKVVLIATLSFNESIFLYEWYYMIICSVTKEIINVSQLWLSKGKNGDTKIHRMHPLWKICNKLSNV